MSALSLLAISFFTCWFSDLSITPTALFWSNLSSPICEEEGVTSRIAIRSLFFFFRSFEFFFIWSLKRENMLPCITTTTTLRSSIWTTFVKFFLFSLSPLLEIFFFRFSSSSSSSTSTNCSSSSSSSRAKKELYYCSYKRHNYYFFGFLFVPLSNITIRKKSSRSKTRKRRREKKTWQE